MVFPNGLPGPSGNAWNIGPCCVPTADDVAFIKALVVQVQATTCLDTKRIYATGFSMGGGMAYYLACHAADVFAAVAPSAFDLLQENAAGCQPTRPISVISFRGSADTLVPYAGGFSAVVPGLPVTFLGAQATFQKWADIDGCSGTPSAPDAAGCSTYRDCQGGAEVTLCTKQGGGAGLGQRRHRLAGAEETRASVAVPAPRVVELRVMMVAVAHIADGRREQGDQPASQSCGE